MVVKTHKRSARSKRSSKKSKSHSGKKTIKSGGFKIFSKNWKPPKDVHTWQDPKILAGTNLRPEFIRRLESNGMKVSPQSLRIGPDQRTVENAQSTLRFALDHEKAMEPILKKLPNAKEYMERLRKQTMRDIERRAHYSRNSEI